MNFRENYFYLNILISVFILLPIEVIQKNICSEQVIE